MNIHISILFEPGGMKVILLPCTNCMLRKFQKVALGAGVLDEDVLPSPLPVSAKSSNNFPTTQPAFIEWQSTIHGSQPPTKILEPKAKSNHKADPRRATNHIFAYRVLFREIFRFFRNLDF